MRHYHRRRRPMTLPVALLLLVFLCAMVVALFQR